MEFTKCLECPAEHLLNNERKQLINTWIEKRESYISKIKTVKLLLIGESMPRDRYFYDIETNYENNGLRYALKQEFQITSINDRLFLQSLSNKGIILYDCALCPLHLIKNNKIKRAAATYCFLNNNFQELIKFPKVPIVTIFPLRRGFLRNKITSDVKNRIKHSCSFKNLIGLKDFYETII